MKRDELVAVNQPRRRMASVTDPDAFVPEVIGVKAVGTFDGFSGRLVVADPCYANTSPAKAPTALALHVKARPGSYEAFALWVRYPRYPVIGARVAHLFVALRDESLPAGLSLDWNDPIGEVGVDSGRLAFYDAARYPIADHDALYDRTSDYGTVDGNLGIVSSSGAGDGYYQVFACRHQGTVVGLLACFLESGFEDLQILNEFRKVVPLLAARQKGSPMRTHFNPPTGSIASYTTQLAWAKYIELRVNAIEVAELNAATFRAMGREASDDDVIAERAKLAAAMRFLRGEMRDDLGFTDEQLDARFARLAEAVESFLEAARPLFYLAIQTVPEAIAEDVSDGDRLRRVERAYKADCSLDASLLAFFNPHISLQTEAPPAPRAWVNDPNVIPLHR